MTNDERLAIFRLAKEAASGFSGKVLFPHVGCIDTNGAVALAILAVSTWRKSAAGFVAVNGAPAGLSEILIPGRDCRWHVGRAVP
jgi:hypothetical protein